MHDAAVLGKSGGDLLGEKEVGAIEELDSSYCSTGSA
jgi:hypothetical protein